MASIFTVAEAVREWLVDHNVKGQDGSMYADMMRRMNEKETGEKKAAENKAIAEAADAEEGNEDQMDEEELERLRKRQAGTLVTEASFLEWKSKFDAEMEVHPYSIPNANPGLQPLIPTLTVTRTLGGQQHGKDGDRPGYRRSAYGQAAVPIESSWHGGCTPCGGGERRGSGGCRSCHR